jgi:hypothetical protein
MVYVGVTTTPPNLSRAAFLPLLKEPNIILHISPIFSLSLHNFKNNKTLLKTTDKLAKIPVWKLKMAIYSP